MKVAVIGGGSSYTPELIKGFLERIERFPLTELTLMDIAPERLEVVGGLARRMVEAQGAQSGPAFQVHLTTDQRQAIRGASYIIAQLRVGGLAARRADEYLGQRHGLIGQETTGVGGMAKALRSIPVILSIAKDIQALSPEALLVNFTNPAGLLTEALSRYTPEVAAVGVCNVPITTKMKILELLKRRQRFDIAPERAELKTLGLNHLSWHYGFTVDGEDIWSRVLAALVAELKEKEQPEWDIATIEALQMIPNSYLQYFYYTDKKIVAQQQWPPSRADTVIELEAKLLAQYAEVDRYEPPADLMKRGGAYYSTMATQLLAAHYHDSGETHVVNTPHRGAVAGWPEDWVLETPCRVYHSGFKPITAEPLPPAVFGLLAQVKSYELLAVEAAVHGDRRAAYQALLAHPLGPPADKIQTVLEDMLTTNKAFLPQFGDSG